MTLEEAKKVLKEIYKGTKFEDSRNRIALTTALNYIENESIPKEKVTEAIEYEKEISKEPASCGYSGTALHGYIARVLKELLGE